MMDDETWMDSATALSKGFVDRVATKAARTQARAFNLSAFANVPEALKSAPPPNSDVDAELAAAHARASARLRLYERAA